MTVTSSNRHSINSTVNPNRVSSHKYVTICYKIIIIIIGLTFIGMCNVLR
jgi:uncharacterized membrane protein YiaA